MATYTLTVDDAQDLYLADLAADSRTTVQRYLDEQVYEALKARIRERDGALVIKAQSGKVLLASEQARLKTVLGLS